MGMAREKKLKQQLREAREALENEIRMHQDTVAMLDTLRRAAKPAMGKIAWLESCIATFREIREQGLI